MVHKSASLLKQKKTRTKGKTRQAMPLPFLLAIILCICSLIFVVWSRIQVTQLGYQLSQASQEQEQLLQKNSQLKIEEASLKTLERIEDVALNQLSLQKPEPSQRVIMP
jgi:cell division protein FtsL